MWQKHIVFLRIYLDLIAKEDWLRADRFLYNILGKKDTYFYTTDVLSFLVCKIMRIVAIFAHILKYILRLETLRTASVNRAYAKRKTGEKEPEQQVLASFQWLGNLQISATTVWGTGKRWKWESGIDISRPFPPTARQDELGLKLPTAVHQVEMQRECDMHEPHQPSSLTRSLPSSEKDLRTFRRKMYEWGRENW